MASIGSRTISAVCRRVPSKQIGKVKDETGTTQSFKFDKLIFVEDIDYRFDTLVQRFREMAFVTRGVTIQFVDDRNDREMTFYFEGGSTSFVRYLNRNRENLHPVVHVKRTLKRSASKPPSNIPILTQNRFTRLQTRSTPLMAAHT